MLKIHLILLIIPKSARHSHYSSCRGDGIARRIVVVLVADPYRVGQRYVYRRFQSRIRQSPYKPLFCKTAIGCIIAILVLVPLVFAGCPGGAGRGRRRRGLVLVNFKLRGDIYIAWLGCSFIQELVYDIEGFSK